MNIEAPPLVDQGVLQVAPGILRNEKPVGANVTQVFIRDEHIVAGLGDGRLVRIDSDGVRTLVRHQGAVTGAAKLSNGSVLSAGQDGKLLLVSEETTSVLLNSEQTWIDALAVSEDGTLVAAAVGKDVSVFSGTELIASFTDHPSTVSGLAFFKDKSQLAVSHYNGVSLWSLADMAKPERLHWAGSVVSVSISPDQRYIASATQDRELHIWDLRSVRDFRLGGYQRKVKSIGWSPDSLVCYTSGADVVVGWKMDDNPGSFPPIEIGYAYAHTVSIVPELSDQTRIVAGFSDGSIQVGEMRGGTAKIARPNSGAEITAIDAPIDSSVVAYGTACGLIGNIKLSELH
ncbi:MAG: hypothetical protein KTR35_05935 [Gammaproteobacteria bacterium]|nr:hypothetical protein [Gammaproteobacteria bacterium]